MYIWCHYWCDADSIDFLKMQTVNYIDAFFFVQTIVANPGTFDSWWLQSVKMVFFFFLFLRKAI